jgi:hypothetical protein
MSIPVSTVPAVKAYLFTALKARSEYAQPVLVCYDRPGTYLPNDIVMVGDVTQTFAPLRMVGSGAQGWLDETYQLEIVVESFQGGDDPQAVTERAASLAAVAVDAVRLDPSLGGLVTQANPISLDYSSTFEDEHLGRRCTATLRVEIYAQI